MEEAVARSGRCGAPLVAAAEMVMVATAAEMVLVATEAEVVLVAP